MKLHNLHYGIILLCAITTLAYAPEWFKGGSWLFMKTPEEQQQAIRAGENPNTCDWDVYNKHYIDIAQPTSLPMSTTLVYANRDEKGVYERAVIVRIAPLGKIEEEPQKKDTKDGAAKSAPKPEEFETYAVSFVEIPNFHARSFSSKKEAQKFAYELLSQKTPLAAAPAKKKLKDRKTAQAWRRAV